MMKSLTAHRMMIFVLLLLLLGTIWFFSFEQKDISNYKGECARFRTEDSLRRVEQEKILKLQIEADELFIDKKYEAAFECYQKLATQNQNDSILRRRERQVAATTNDDRPVATYYIPVKNTDNNNLDSLQNHIGTLLQILSEEQEKRKSAQEELNGRVMLLENMLDETKKELKSVENAKGSLRFKSAKNIEVRYFGEIKDNKADGKGIGLWGTGSIYEGEWKANNRHGKGVFTWDDGEKYEGNYVDDHREGQGIYYWKNGERYDGEWKNDKRHGHGKVYDKKGKVKLEGEWKDDRLETK